jgi:hypothetical protein
MSDPTRKTHQLVYLMDGEAAITLIPRITP